MELEGRLKLKRELRLHPGMVQGIGLLSLSKWELQQFLQEQLASNPFLEEASFEELSSQEQPFSVLDLGLPGQEAPELPAPLSPLQCLWPQVLELGLSFREKRAALLLLGNLDERGYLEGDLESLAQESSLDLEELQGLRQRLQHLDPPGLACFSLLESLQVQLEQRYPRELLAKRILWEGSGELFGGRKEALAVLLGCSLEELQRALKLIASLDPFPGRSLGGGESPPSLPDIQVYLEGNHWKAQLLFLPQERLRWNSHYGVQEPRGASPGDQAYWRQHSRGARSLLESLRQRRRALAKIAHCLVEWQQDFFHRGPVGLRPMTLQQLAHATGLHVSTVSRISRKTCLLGPQGLWELKSFFSSSLQSTRPGEEAISSRSVVASLRSLLLEEDPGKPYSDQALVELLSQRGIQVARRTVAKYRKQEGFPGASKRYELSLGASRPR